MTTAPHSRHISGTFHAPSLLPLPWRGFLPLHPAWSPDESPIVKIKPTVGWVSEPAPPHVLCVTAGLTIPWSWHHHASCTSELCSQLWAGLPFPKVWSAPLPPDAGHTACAFCSLPPAWLWWGLPSCVYRLALSFLCPLWVLFPLVSGLILVGVSHQCAFNRPPGSGDSSWPRSPGLCLFHAVPHFVFCAFLGGGNRDRDGEMICHTS